LARSAAIYHARFMRYLTHRNLLNCAGRKVWGVFGDGEMDEPESMSALTLAAREKLDNLVWVVNCNLQRLDGPVRGNGRIIDELEKLFAGRGLERHQAGVGQRLGRPVCPRPDRRAGAARFAHTVDGQMQTFAAKDGRFNRDNFFGQNDPSWPPGPGHDRRADRPPQARRPRPGEDPRRLCAAAAHKGQPTVILAHTKKGYGMGRPARAR
jgi:pyruvate dehydrogenase E1 component